MRANAAASACTENQRRVLQTSDGLSEKTLRDLPEGTVAVSATNLARLKFAMLAVGGAHPDQLKNPEKLKLSADWYTPTPSDLVSRDVPERLPVVAAWRRSTTSSRRPRQATPARSSRWPARWASARTTAETTTL